MSDDTISTGLAGAIVSSVTATVTEPAPQPPAVLPQIPAGWTIPTLSALARDLAIHLYDDDVILKKHNVTDAHYEALKNNPYFVNLLASASKEWNNPASIQQRLALEAAVALEDALPTIGARMQKDAEPLAGVIEAGKLLAKMSGVGESKTPVAPGERFSITINLGEDKLTFEKTNTPGTEVGVRKLGEAQSESAPLLELTKG